MFRSLICLCVVTAACAAPLITSNKPNQNQAITIKPASEIATVPINNDIIISAGLSSSESKSVASNMDGDLKSPVAGKRVRRFLGDGHKCARGYIRVLGICTLKQKPKKYFKNVQRS